MVDHQGVFYLYLADDLVKHRDSYSALENELETTLKDLGGM